MANEVLVDADYLIELQQAAKNLEALYRYGVDNWDGYDDAMEDVE